MWRLYHANTSCHAMTLTFDPLTLKVCGRSDGIWSSSVLNLIEIEQLPAELFTIWQIFARVTSRCDLDLWPLDLELLWSFWRHVFKLCVKFDQNRTIRCRVIDDLAHYRREIFEGSQIGQTFSGVHEPNFTKLWEDMWPWSVVTEFVSDLRYLAAFSNAGRSKLSDVENEAKFRTFWPPVKIRGGVGEISGLRFKALPRTEPRV